MNAGREKSDAPAAVEPAELISSGTVASMLGLASQTLANWRSEGYGPRYIKVGRQVYYLRSDICVWLAAQIREPKAVA